MNGAETGREIAMNNCGYARVNPLGPTQSHLGASGWRSVARHGATRHGTAGHGRARQGTARRRLDGNSLRSVPLCAHTLRQRLPSDKYNISSNQNGRHRINKSTDKQINHTSYDMTQTQLTEGGTGDWVRGKRNHVSENRDIDTASNRHRFGDFEIDSISKLTSFLTGHQAIPIFFIAIRIARNFQ